MNNPNSSQYPDYPPSGQPGEPSSYPPRPASVVVRPPQVKPVVTYVIMGITIAVYLLQMLSQSMYGYDLPASLGAKVNSAILAGQLWRLITPILLHGSILHIGFNMYALYILGPALERQYGPWRYLVLYLLAGFAGNAVSLLFSTSAAVGASTSIFGLIGAQAALIYQNKRLLGSRYQPLIRNTLFIAGINLLFGLTPGSNIDNWGHIGGLIGGGLFALLAGPIWEVEGLYPNVHLADQRNTSQVILAAVVVAIFFGVIVFLGINAGLAHA